VPEHVARAEEVGVIEHREEVELGQTAVCASRPEAREPDRQRAERREDVVEQIERAVGCAAEHRNAEQRGDDAEEDDRAQLLDVSGAARQRRAHADGGGAAQPHRDRRPDAQSRS
jgi:hypothetical protein